MMKKVISLILVAVMLLGVLPAVAFAQTAIFDGYTLSLGDSIAVEFYAKEAKLADFDKLIFYKNGTEVQQITTCPEAESDGFVYFQFDKLGPHEMDANITAELYLTTASEAEDTQTVSILNYCTAILGTTSDDALKKLIVNMLYYGAEAQTYTGSGTGISDYIAALDADVQALRDTSEVSSSQLTKTLFKETTDPTVTWSSATLVLNAGIVPSFTFTTAEDVAGLTAVATCAGKVWQTSSFAADGSSYTFDFTGLNPSQLCNPIYVEIRNAQGDPVSNICAFTAEYYTAMAAEAEKALANAMMNYGNAAKAYILRDIATTGILSAAEESALKAFTGENQYEFKTFAADAYAAAGIDLSQYIPYDTWFNLAGKIFDTSTAGQDALRLATDEAADETLCDMLVSGCYGGNRNTTGKTFEPDDFKVGDLFFGARSCPATSSMWNYIVGVYQGDGKFLLFDSHPTSCAESCESTVLVDAAGSENTIVWGDAEAMNAYRLYFVLRPQSASRRDITTGVLTTEEMAALASYEIKLPYFWYTIAADTYAAAGIESSAFDSSLSYNNLRTNVFSTTESDYTKMLVPGFYGGSKKSTGKTFTPADLKVGDIIATATSKCANGSWTYLTGVYQGEGKFQVSKRCCNLEGCSGVYEDTYGATLTDGKLENGMTSFWATAAQLEAAYEYYFVLRPERLAADALQSVSLSETALALATRETATLTTAKTPAAAADPVSKVWTSSAPAVATVDQNGKVTALSAGTTTITVNCDGYTASCEVAVTNRNITTGALSAEEMDAIASYEPNGGDQWYTLATEAYNEASISVDAFDTKIGFNDLYPKVFSTTEETDYTKMLVPGFYGGASKSTGKSFTPSDLKVGDIFCTAYGYTANKCEGGSWRYVTALYVGNGKFRVNIRCCTTGTCLKTYDDVYGTELTNGYTSLWSDADTLETVFKYYFVLRPERLAADALQSISLNKTELTVTTLYSETLTVTGNPASALGSVSWTSSDPAIATVDANGKVSGVAAGTTTITANCEGYTVSCEVTVAATREITAGALTAAEMAAIAAYETSTPGTLAQFAEAAYGAAGIDLDPVTGSYGVGDVRKQLIVDGTGALIEGTTVWHSMLVEGSNGGSANAESTKTFTTADFQAGDIFCAQHQCEHGKWIATTAVYQGDGKFLVDSYQTGCACNGVYVDDINDVNANGLLSNGRVSIWAEDAATLKAAFKHFFVLRPSNLAN